MSISVSSVATTTSTTSSTGSTSASEAYNTFLTLLTTQLQNQDPLNPTDTTEFTNQLISLSGIEQQLETNEMLGNISDNLAALTSSSGLGYIGKTVDVTGDTAPLQDGTATWGYDLASDADSVALQITDSNGNVVWTGTGETGAGEHSLTWDGSGLNGQQYSDGAYTLTVTAKNPSGNPIDVSTTVTGTVTGTDSSSGTTQLLMDDVALDIGDVVSVQS